MSSSSSGLELADIFREYGPSYRQTHALSIDQQRAMRAIELCRTARLGGHVDKCDSCGAIRLSYNSCRNRHCPKCQSLAKAEWLEERMRELLPVEYFHIVFTLPDCFNQLALQNKRIVYDLLFRSASQTLIRIAADPKHLGAQVGFTAVLHTWGQNLMLHPHLHCIVAGGGLRGERWVSCRKGFFLPVRVLSRLFRCLFLKFLKQAFDRSELDFHGSSEQSAFPLLLLQAASMEWVVYAKRPFGDPAQVLQYLGQYTHRVAISNHRLLKLESAQVTFKWRDYRDNNRIKPMTLDAEEFIRRFLLHILPDGFQRIRHFGFLSCRCKTEKLLLCKKSLGLLADSQSQSKQPQDWKSRYEQLTGVCIDACPVCRQGRMLTIEILNPLRFSPIIAGIDSS